MTSPYGAYAEPGEPRVAARASVADDALVLPVSITAGIGNGGPRFGQDVWDLSGFVPRTTRLTRVDFKTLADPLQCRTAKEFLYSRIDRAVATNQVSASCRPMKMTASYNELAKVRRVLGDLERAGAARLAEVERQHLEEVLARWKLHPSGAAGLVSVVKHLFAHGPFLTDRLAVVPWPGRNANLVAGRTVPAENATLRIPEQVMAPFLRAAVFYVETASADLLAARREIAALEAARAGRRLGRGAARAALERFVEDRRASGRGIPALAPQVRQKRPEAKLAGGGSCRRPTSS